MSEAPVWNYDMPLGYFIWIWASPVVFLVLFFSLAARRIVNSPDALNNAFRITCENLFLALISIFMSYAIGGLIWGNWSAWL